MKKANVISQMQGNSTSKRRGFLKKLGGVLAGVALSSSLTKAQTKEDGTKSTNSGFDPYIGDIIMVGFNFAPIGWVKCDGQLLPISQYDALFALIGTTYGGDGVSNFAVPDLRGRLPIHQGQGTGLSNRVIGQYSGKETHTLLQSELPSHSHTLMANSNAGNTDTPLSSYISKNNEGVKQFAASSTGNSAPLGIAGGNGLHANIQPYQVVNFLIATEGSFPTQN